MTYLPFIAQVADGLKWINGTLERVPLYGRFYYSWYLLLLTCWMNMLISAFSVLIPILSFYKCSLVFGVDILFPFPFPIINRSSHLRCLTINVFSVLNTMSIKKLTQLEELHLVILPWLTAEDFESIGIACPMLKSFTYYNDWVGYPEFTEHAVAIGKNMPNLRHFRLYSHNIENKGLEAILDGCPNLESLHLRKCFGLDLQGVLG